MEELLQPMLHQNKTFQCISPVDNSIYVERSYAADHEIESALAKAIDAQIEWKSLSIKKRGDYCKKAVEYFISHADEIGLELTWQMGRPIRYAPFEISKGFHERAIFMIDQAEEALKDIVIPAEQDFQKFIKREPLGTVFVLAPWNYPFLTSVNAVIPALMAGNVVLLKHATQTPLCAERYAEAFEYAGLPEGVFQYLHLDHDQVAKAIKDNRIDYVAFTGSVAGGAAIQKAMSNRFINAGLELGGKDPAYVRADADLDFTIENLVEGSFFNSGQSCCGIERIYVHESIYNDFVNRFVDLTKQYKLANPLETETTLGPMVRKSAVAFVKDQIAKAVSKGATTMIESGLFEKDEEGTTYMAPQVLVNVNHEMEVMTEESFGPVVGIMSVSSDEEAINLMNDSQYGLTASIWTSDIETGVGLGDRVETGTFFINRCDYLDPALAWTGVKNSGRGCTLSSLGYEVLTRPKSFHIKKVG